MAMVKKSITLTDQQANWIKAKIKSGLYGNESEVLRELIRERQVREQEQQDSYGMAAIRAKLIKAEQSGLSVQSIEEVLREIDGHFGLDHH